MHGGCRCGTEDSEVASQTERCVAPLHKILSEFYNGVFTYPAIPLHTPTQLFALKDEFLVYTLHVCRVFGFLNAKSWNTYLN